MFAPPCSLTASARARPRPHFFVRLYLGDSINSNNSYSINSNNSYYINSNSSYSNSGHSAEGGAVGGGVQWTGVALYSKIVYNTIQITTPCFHCTPLCRM